MRKEVLEEVVKFKYLVVTNVKDKEKKVTNKLNEKRKKLITVRKLWK